LIEAKHLRVGLPGKADAKNTTRQGGLEIFLAALCTALPGEGV